MSLVEGLVLKKIIDVIFDFLLRRKIIIIAYTAYKITINVCSFNLMNEDKRIKDSNLGLINRDLFGKARITNELLFNISLFGGSIGTYIGMLAFRHKLSNKPFRDNLYYAFLVNTIQDILFCIAMYIF